jgi:hypothetical protein
MGKTKKPEEKAITKSITILPRHQQYIEDGSINLSHFVQKKIDEEIGKKEPEKKKGAKK